MEQQRFTSLTGRARQWLPPEELEPERQSVRRSVVSSAPGSATSQASSMTPSRPLASLGDLVRYKDLHPRRTIR
jgi:hypothetical protein